MHLAKTPDNLNYTIYFQDAKEAQEVIDKLAALPSSETIKAANEAFDRKIDQTT